MTESHHQILGIDVGGTGIKGGIVNVHSGEMLTDRHKFATPQPATAHAIAGTVAQLVSHFDWHGSLGIGFPAVIKDGIAHTAANIHRSCLGTDMKALISEKCGGRSVHILNDADAAGLAEMRFGAGKNKNGTVLMLTVGTGIGSALFLDGQLMPNTELGHLFLENGWEGEKYASSVTSQQQGVPLSEWAARLNVYLKEVEKLLWPDHLILGGGISKSFEQYAHLLETRAVIVPAMLRNHSGAVGAALAAAIYFDSQ